MVLADLGTKLKESLNKLRKQTVIDDAALDACLKEMALALLSHDVNVKYVSELRGNVKKAVT